MRHLIARRLAIEVIMVGAMIAGGWFGLLKPLEARLATAKAREASQELKIEAARREDANRASPPETRLRELTARAVEIDRQSRASGEPAMLYDTLTGAAASHGVRIDRLDPKRRATTANRRPGSRTEIESVEYTIIAIGAFDAVARFVAQLEHEIGLTRITALRVAPRPGDSSQEVTATIETSHYRLVRSLLEPDPRPASPAATKRGTK
ncbi:MAG: hypothetical protein DYG93_04225 [Leptolyngbya sp. PLA2]|nr:hypothetical protein [Leptolyngbya sp.]MCE7970856.1 hypothetical protein [Leptolyngbya sp. PL-A2]MCQ3940329.1 hypothetical protein [cyanobacterium CYA1]MCZ7633696.1 type II secretion system protein M [Phycisphaerales bacterium]MDL1904601.1 type II secretion system protein M [Synechococcales cyanobacterium CNB]GIK17868.1 MAG: hypothetical protein BroJett004_00320 [Planctomycetota bacterium]